MKIVTVRTSTISLAGRSKRGSWNYQNLKSLEKRHPELELRPLGTGYSLTLSDISELEGEALRGWDPYL